MVNLKWRWVLPVMQVTFALIGHVYEPRQYRTIAQKDRAVNNLNYYLQHHPAVVGRISHGLNFPALVLDYPLHNSRTLIYERNTDYTLIQIRSSDIGFFAAVLLFWCWVGSIIDRRQGTQRDLQWPTWVQEAMLLCGIAFSVLMAVYALGMLKTEWRPQKQIGMFGVLWSILLLAYFVSRFARSRKQALGIVKQ